MGVRDNAKQPGDRIFEGRELRVYLLPGDVAAADEWNGDVDTVKFLAAFEAADTTLQGPAKRISTNRAIKLESHEAGWMWEWKAPKQGKRIYRAIAYCPYGHRMYLTFLSDKKSQKLSRKWIETAKARVSRAINRGETL